MASQTLVQNVSLKRKNENFFDAKIYTVKKKTPTEKLRP